MLSEAKVLLQTLPAEMSERHQYLEAARSLREDFASSAKKLNEWIEVAKDTLDSGAKKKGVNYEKILNCIDEHQEFFSADSEAKELAGKIQKLAEKILPSMRTADQEGLSRQVCCTRNP